MSVNNSVNALISLIEDRPELAREIFRAPLSDVKNIGEATARLYQAIDKRVAKEIRKLLIKSLSVQADNPETESDFYKGVRAVEEIFEKHLEQLEG